MKCKRRMQHLGKVMARQNAQTAAQQSANLYCGFGCNPFNGSYGTIGGINIDGRVSYTPSNGVYSTLNVRNAGNLPDRLFNQLITAGASADFLNTVTIEVWDPDVDPGCACDRQGNCPSGWSDGNTVIFCGSGMYDTDRVGPTLVHELVHIAKYQEDPSSYWKVRWWNLVDLIRNTRNNPYEKDPWACTFVVDETYKQWKPLPRLNEPPCNLP